MTTLSTSLNKLKEFLADNTTSTASKQLDQSIVHRNVFQYLCDIAQVVEVSLDPLLIKDDNLAVLEELCLGKKINLIKTYQSMLLIIYLHIIKQGPGYVIRNLLSGMINLFNNKLLTVSGRECAIEVLGMIMARRINDCASQVTEVFINMGKLIKANEASIRLASLKCLSNIVVAENGRMSDLYVEIAKIAGRSVTDKVPEVRKYSAELIEAIARFSDGFTIVAADALQPFLVKGLEDENAETQDAFVRAIAAIYEMQIRAYEDKQEQNKIGAARGSDNATTTPVKAKSTSRLSFSKLTLKKATVEEPTDYHTVIENIIKCIYKNTANLRVGYIFVLGYVIGGYLDKTSAEDLLWMVPTIMSIPQDNSIQNLSYEEQNIFRIRLSHIFRTYVIAKVNESQLLSIAGELLKQAGGMDATTKTELELQHLLFECNHICTVLGHTVVAIQDEIMMTATIQLKHASFGVRSAAANLLLTLSILSPSVVVNIVNTSILHTKNKTKELLEMDGIDVSAVVGGMEEDGESSPTPSSNAAAGNNPNPNSNPTLAIKKKSPQELEKLSKMFFFHGHTLVLSMIMKHSSALPNGGLPLSTVLEIFDLGLFLLAQDITATTSSLRHVVCSIIRAGGLLLSSCLSMGYAIAKHRIALILQQVVRLTRLFENATIQKVEDALYEMMCMESAIICITSLLRYTSEALVLEMNCLQQVIEQLEWCFKTIKLRYQASLKHHFRFKTLHMILLETFIYLPPGSYPNTLPQVYIEALRVFRDCVSMGYECSANLLQLCTQSEALFVNDNSLKNHLNVFTSNDTVMNQMLVMYKLEHFIVALEKKEHEAFLSMLGKEQPSVAVLRNSMDQLQLQAQLDGRLGEDLLLDSMQHDLLTGAVNNCGLHVSAMQAVSSSVIDTRMLDTSMRLIATTFAHQSNEYQDKATQLFHQALTQLTAVAAGNNPANANASATSISSRLSLTSSNSSATSAVSSLTASSSSSSSSLANKGLSLFTSSSQEEERKRREKRVFSICKNVICAYQLLVHAFPMHAGRYAEQDYPWRQSMIDHVYDMLSHPDFNIKHSAAMTIFAFAKKWKQSNLVSTVCTKIRTTFISSLEKKTDTQSMNIYTGYVMVLAYLWIHSVDDLDTRSLIQTTIFDCLRKLDHSSLLFQSYVIMAWTLLCQGHMDEYSLQNTPELLKQKTQEVEDLLEKVVYHTQAMLANTMHIGQEDYVWLIQSLIRVVGHSLSLVQVYHLSEGLATRLKSLWKVLRQITKHLLTSSTRHILLPALYQTYLCIQSHDQTREFTKEIFDFLKNQLFHAEYDELVEAVTQTSGAMLWSACQLLQSLVKQELLDANSTHSSALLSPPLAYAFLGQLIDACFVKLAGTSFIAQSHVEFSHDYLAVEPDYEHMAKCFQVIFTTWRQVQRHHLQHNADEKLTWYLMMYRSLALGLHLNIAHQSEGGSTAAQEGASSTSNTRDDDEDFFDGEGGSSPAVASSSSGAASSANPSKSSTAIVGGVLEDEHEYTIGSYGQFVTFFREQILRQVPSFKSASRLVMKSVSIFFASECMYYYQHQQDNTLYHETHADLGLARAFLVKVCDGKAKKGKEWMSLDCIPMILFLQDIVNMTCACASFTVQDKHILALQVSSMHLLADVIHVFHAAVDVDAVQPTGSNIVDYSYDKLLTQSLSQLLAAIRTGLSVDHCPRLHFATYSCLLSLIESGYLRDKVAFKRLLKPIISYSEDNHLLNTASNSATGLQPYSYSKVLPEEQSIMEKLFYFHLVACFSCIIANSNNASKELSVYGKHTESGIRSVLAATFQPFSSLTQDYSRYLLLDMIRILQWRAAQSASSSLDDGNAGKDNSEADGSSSATEGANDSKELHPNRGGFTYPTSTKFMNLWPAYVECFPTFAFLYLRSKQENAVKLVATCTQSLLVDMVQSNHKLSNKLTSNTWIELLSVIESLTQQQAEHVDILNVDYWQSLILNLATLGHTQVLPSSSTIHVYLLTILNHVVSSAQTQSQELKDAIQTKMWKVFVQLIRVILPGIFGEDKSSKLCSADDWLLLVGKSTASKEQANVLLLTLQVVSRLQTLSEGRSDANQYVLQWMTRLTMAILHHSVDKSSTVQALVTTMIQNALNTTSSPQKIVYVQFQEMNQVMFKAAQQYAQSNIVDVQMKIVASFDLSVMTWLQLYQGASNALPQTAETSQQLLIAWLLWMQSTQSSTYRNMMQMLSQRVFATAPNIAIQATHQWLLPLVLTGLLPNANKPVDWEERVLYIRFYLQFFNYIQQYQSDNLNNFVQISLTILCQSIQSYQHEEVHVQLCGKALTLMARQASDIFRTQIAGLTDESKQWLQYAMKAALQQEQGGNAGASSASSSGTPAPLAKSINMDKYRK